MPFGDPYESRVACAAGSGRYRASTAECVPCRISADAYGRTGRPVRGGAG